jgi:hypothetical protein
VPRLASEEATVSLRLAGGTVHVANGGATADDEAFLPLAILNPLVTGFPPRAELLAQPGVSVGSERAARLLEILFPSGYPHWTAAAYYQE